MHFFPPAALPGLEVLLDLLLGALFNPLGHEQWGDLFVARAFVEWQEKGQCARE